MRGVSNSRNRATARIPSTARTSGMPATAGCQQQQDASKRRKPATAGMTDACSMTASNSRNTIYSRNAFNSHSRKDRTHKNISTLITPVRVTVGMAASQATTGVLHSNSRDTTYSGEGLWQHMTSEEVLLENMNCQYYA